MCFLLCDGSKPPQKVKAQGSKGNQLQALILVRPLAFLYFSSTPSKHCLTCTYRPCLVQLADNANNFQVNMIDAPGHNFPMCCCGSLCALTGVTACYARNAVLSAYGKGIEGKLVHSTPSPPDSSAISPFLDFVCFQGYVTMCGAQNCCKVTKPQNNSGFPNSVPQPPQKTPSSFLHVP